MGTDAHSRDPRPEALFVIGSLHIGGTERHVSEIAPALSAKGYRITVLCLTDLGPYAHGLSVNGVEVLGPPVAREKLRWLGPLARYVSLSVTAIRLLGLLIRRRPRIVQCFLPAANIAAVPIARAALVECVVSSRRSMNNFQSKYPLLGALDRRMHGCVDAIVANSKAAAKQLTDEEGARPDKVWVIHNGIDPTRLKSPLSRAASRTALGIGDRSLVFVIVANLIAYKGHLDLLSALARAADALPADWTLLLVGRDDGTGAEIAGAARNLGLDRNVRIMGSRTDIAGILCAADIGLLVSHEEGFPNVILEYMAAGLPVIATAVGGNPEAVADGETGIIVPKESRDELAHALLTLAGDERLRRAMGDAGRTRVENLFSLEACAQAYDRLYQGLLAANHRKGRSGSSSQI